jgi:hypothetical protein
MKSVRYVRALCLAVTLLVPTAFGASADRQQAQAQVLDQAELLCANCFFGTSDYYFCFAADNKILIGYQATPVINWQDNSKNYLTRVHRSWMAWTAPGQTVPISFDEKHIWVARPDGKQVKLTQSYSRDVFTNSAQCKSAVKVKAN